MIGLGNIGLPLAINLVRSGLSVLGYSKDGLEAFVRAGGVAAGSASEVASRFLPFAGRSRRGAAVRISR